MKAEFQCVNCDSTVERNLMPWKHAVLGAIPEVSREASCCENPEYRDLEGFQKPKSGKSLRQSIPGFA